MSSNKFPPRTKSTISNTIFHDFTIWLNIDFGIKFLFFQTNTYSMYLLYFYCNGYLTRTVSFISKWPLNDFDFLGAICVLVKKSLSVFKTIILDLRLFSLLVAIEKNAHTHYFSFVASYNNYSPTTYAQFLRNAIYNVCTHVNMFSTNSFRVKEPLRLTTKLNHSLW